MTLKGKLKRAIRPFVPKRLRFQAPPSEEPDPEREAYLAVSKLGVDSSNEWIARSASIEGWLFAGEHELLWELASRGNEGHVLEIGTWMGKSACILAGACADHAPNTRVYCVDPFDMMGTPDQEDYHKRLVEESGTFYQFIGNARRLGFHDWVVPVGTVAQNAIPHLPGGFRLAFIDGAHDYLGVSTDCRLALAQLRVGGVLAIHDARSEVWVDIGRYVEDELMHDSSLRYLTEAGSLVAFEKVAQS